MNSARTIASSRTLVDPYPLANKALACPLRSLTPSLDLTNQTILIRDPKFMEYKTSHKIHTLIYNYVKMNEIPESHASTLH